ncbi:uncharacterized protein FIBRA_02630 [Fibroporia radiculosa]|uniref:Trimethylguanosine synthase n=1 Tax=Fibroporia radiculosa TaxID=599839 RepID=J4H1Y7_9APHY|nr:uncharacterized protein FIBRA_02630 [Fibroporia radiculosa]CCM00594.1 predicted protein [Fibroporia radiculosa]
MGRKHSAISGLSRFVSEVFETSESQKPGQSAALATSDSGVSSATTSNLERRASEWEEGEPQGLEARPTKKRKTGLLGSGLEKYDATGLVPFYTHPSQIPSHLQKYYSQRERYFSRYSSGCLLDEEGWYSVTPERVANQIAERCRCDVVLDAFCGVGGNAIAFAKTCERVIALDTSPVRLALARHNAALYGVADRIEFILADFISFAQNLAESPAFQDPLRSRKVDVIFLSPPWGGPSYLTDRQNQEVGATQHADDSAQSASEYSLASIRPIHGKMLFKLARRLTRNVAYYLPRNVSLEEVAALLEQNNESGGEEMETEAERCRSEPTSRKARKQRGKEKADREVEMVEVEEEWMGQKLKALTCYFGGLVADQQHLF